MSAVPPSERRAAWLEGLVHAFLESPQNALCYPGGGRAWGEALVGFAAGDDPLFDEFQRHIGAFHWTPKQAFELGHLHLQAASAELTVISWILPQTLATRRDNRRQSLEPAPRWVHAKWFGEQVNRALRAHVVSALAEAGVPAVAPLLLPEWSEAHSERYGDASTWSERHAAYAAGLGTFGLSDGLITAAGKAMRCGSVVARLAVPPTPRPYTDRHAYCLFYFGHEGCSACVRRCPAGAISEAGHDKGACLAYLEKVRTALIEPAFGFSTDACGLCQTKVPCEAHIPPELRSA